MRGIIAIIIIWAGFVGVLYSLHELFHGHGNWWIIVLLFMSTLMFLIGADIQRMSKTKNW